MPVDGLDRAQLAHNPGAHGLFDALDDFVQVGDVALFAEIVHSVAQPEGVPCGSDFAVRPCARPRMRTT
jgi:hypothetical protein